MQRISCWLLVVLVGTVTAASPDATLEHEEATLREAGIAPEDEAILELLRQRTLLTGDTALLRQLVVQLGDDSFEAREQASKALLSAGRKALPFLRPALNDSDLERARRAELCVEAIEGGLEQSLTMAAARVLTARRTPGAVEVLLAYLPQVDDPVVMDILHESIQKLTLREDRVEPAVVAALRDPVPARRAVAALALGRRSAAHRQAVIGLLRDPDPLVRYQAARGLLDVGYRPAVPVLIDLVGEGPGELAWLAEAVLYRLAGEEGGPPGLRGDEVAARHDARDGWRKWWQANESRIELGRMPEETVLGIRLVCELQGGKEGGGRVLEYGPDGRIRWEIHNVSGPIDVQRTARGTVLLAEINSRRVTERDSSGRILFEKDLSSSPMVAQPLPGGNIFIATYEEVLEVTRSGRVVYSHPVRDGRLYYARKLPSGRILYVHNEGEIIEMEPGSGKVLRRVAAGDTSNWGSVEPLPGGHFLVCRCGLHQVAEIDASGKEVWTYSVQWPTWAGRLPGGRTLIACAHSGQVLEVDRSGKVVWKESLDNRPCRCRGY